MQPQPEAREKETPAEPKPKTLKELSVAEMEALISTLPSPAGRGFMLGKLKRDGVQSVVALVEQKSALLKPGTTLERSDFSDADQQLIRRAPVGAFQDRRTFLRTAAWGIGGFIEVARGVTKLGRVAYHTASGKPVSGGKNGDTHFDEALDHIDKVGSIPEDLCIGGALIYVSVLNTDEMKMQGVSKAIGALIEHDKNIEGGRQ